jgi:hypothetical protein
MGASVLIAPLDQTTNNNTEPDDRRGCSLASAYLCSDKALA